METKTTTLEETLATWTRDPDRGRSKPTATARVEDGQAAIQAGPFTLRADLPAPLGGTNQAPSPTALLLSALAGCAVAFVYDTLGPQLGVRINGVEATARCAADARGLLGMDGADPDLRELTVDITVDSPDGEEAVAEVARVWQERCPIYLALQRPTDVTVQFRAA
ncbi:osmotically inducible protein OsmC [Streptomyces sp. WZ.A104]|uniref:OsmC family protein n=1 Tax=Streptomyces sp. WZ.A104 TaxID=2023771 RepID=UPI000BBBAA71|nr:OsmC family protein [Streptomyces sp. WZ.A104]PCG83547.1 osmotically inducible protein OsmC [Streptomyces sp. WZ.A104]